MKTILATTDFSSVSLNAVNYAADMALNINARLVLFHVCLLPISYSEIPYPAENMEELQNDAEDRLRQLKEDLEKRTAGKVIIDTEVQIGSFITTIIDYCESLHPFIIVLGTQGAGALERLFFGSNTIATIKNLSWPIMVIPPEAKFTELKKIGLACDMKNVAETSPIKEIKTLVKLFSAELFVLYVNKATDPIYSTQLIKETDILHEILKDMKPDYYFVNNTDIEGALSQFAERNNLDMLIVIPKKHTLVEQLFHQSQSKKIVLHTHVPVMAIHE